MKSQQLTGRSEELVVLETCLSPAHEGGRSAALIRGRPGSGKSFLATHFARRAQKRGVLVAGSSLRTRHSGTPYALWIRILEDLVTALERDPDCDDPQFWVFGENGDALGHIVPHLTGGRPAAMAPAALRAGIPKELLRVFARIAQRKPILLIVDNLQFADDSSLKLFGDLCSSLKLQRDLTLCVTLRDPYQTTRAHLADAVSGLLDELQAFRLSLGPFSREEVAAFLTSCGAAVSSELVEEVYRITEGNPLFVSQFGSLDVHGCRDLNDRIAPSQTVTVEDRLLEYFELRMTELDEATAAILCAAGVLGGEFGLPEIVAAAGTDINREVLIRSLRNAVALSFLDEIPNEISAGPPSYRFHHELLRKAVVRSSDPSALQDAHYRVAAYLKDGEPTGPPEGELSPSELLSRGKRLAHIGDHLLYSGRPAGISEAVNLLIRAGEHFLAGGAWEDAEAVLSRLQSEQHGVLTRCDRGRVEYGIGRARLYLGRRIESFGCLKAALECFAAAGDTAHIAEVALQPVLIDAGDTPYLEILSRATRALGETHPERPRVEAYYAAALALVSGEYERAYHILTEEASPSALESIDVTDSLRARAFIAYLSLRRSSFAEAYEALEEAEDLLRSHPDPVAESIVVGTRYELARLTGELGDAWELLLRRRIIDEEIGDPYLLAETFLRLGRLSVKGGDWPRARSYFCKAIERRQGDPITLANLVTLETLVGNREEAQAHLDLLLKDAEQQERGPQAVFIAAASGLVVTALLPDTATGTAADTGVDEHRLRSALRIVERARGGAREHPFIAVRRLVLSAVISYYLDRRNKSEELLHELTHMNHFNTIDHGHIERATGLLHYLRGSHLEGAAALRRAASEFKKRGDLPHALLVESEHLLELAGVDPNEAAPRIEHTLSVCRYNGMDGLAQFIRRHAAKRPAQQRVPSTIALSRREEEVLRLLAAGLSDKEIAGRLNISIHTASNHVRHILAKSDSNNRTQAVTRLLTDSPKASQR